MTDKVYETGNDHPFQSHHLEVRHPVDLLDLDRHLHVTENKAQKAIRRGEHWKLTCITRSDKTTAP